MSLELKGGANLRNGITRMAETLGTNDIGNATLHWIALALEERLRAPEDGKILKVLSKEGEMVTADTPVILLQSNRSYYDIYISEQQARGLAEGDTITGTTVAGGRQVTGTIKLLTQAPGFADLKQSREKGQADLTAFQVRIYIDPQDGVVPGMTIGVNAREFAER